jgi:hypothetical protein
LLAGVAAQVVQFLKIGQRTPDAMMVRDCMAVPRIDRGNFPFREPDVSAEILQRQLKEAHEELARTRRKTEKVEAKVFTGHLSLDQADHIPSLPTFSVPIARLEAVH